MKPKKPESRKPPAFVLVGLPGSGKSTWARNHPAKLAIASTDAFIEGYAQKKKITYGEAFPIHYKTAMKKMKAQVEALKKKKTPFIWDQTNLTKIERDAIYKILHATHDVIFVCFMVPLDVCLKQFRRRERDGGNAVDEKKILELARVAVFPKKGEPCDRIIRIVHKRWPRRAK